MRTPRGLSRLLTRSAVFADDVVPSVGDVAESTVSRQVGHRQGVLADHQNSTDDRHTNTQTDTTDCCTPQTTDTPTHRDGHDRLLHSTDDECTDRDDGDGHEDAVGGRVASKSADRPAQTAHVEVLRHHHRAGRRHVDDVTARSRDRPRYAVTDVDPLRGSRMSLSRGTAVLLTSAAL